MNLNSFYYIFAQILAGKEMTTESSKIIYTITDEAPALATQSLLPIIQAFTASSGIDVDTRDISLAGRIIANFPKYLTEDQRIGDALVELGELAKTPEANIIKLPNISASIPQLQATIKELQAKGYNLPDYPEEPQNEAEESIKLTYAKVLGSAVNPVLREGNSDRRAPGSVKQYARNNPHSMGAWSQTSKSHVASMSEGDFYGSEKSTTIDGATSVKIEFVNANGDVKVLKENLNLLDKEVIDASVMSKSALVEFFDAEINKAKDEDVLLSLHLKATMMKVSDPIMFGHAVKVFYKDVFAKHAATFEQLGVDANNGIGDVYAKIGRLSAEKKAEIEEKAKQYLVRSVKFKCIDYQRKEIVKRKYEKETLHVQDAVVQEPFEEDTSTGMKDALMLAISELPEKTRDVFMLCKLDGLSYKEIAEHFSISPKTVENQMGRAFRHLREKLHLYKGLLLFLIFFTIE